MLKKTKAVLFLFVLGFVCRSIFADTAVDLDPSSYAGAPAAGSNHGWQFTVNNSIKVTHLGLFDKSDNGFAIDHPIGLWRLNDGTLLTSGTISAGTVDPLTDHFRYIDVPDVQLSVGVDYVIGFYSDTDFADRMISDADALQINPAINLIVGRWDGGGQFQMPANVLPDEDEFGDPQPYPDRFGPNFLFVPEPMTLLLLGLGGVMLRRRSRQF